MNWFHCVLINEMLHYIGALSPGVYSMFLLFSLHADVLRMTMNLFFFAFNIYIHTLLLLLFVFFDFATTLFLRQAFVRLFSTPRVGFYLTKMVSWLIDG